MGNVRNELTDPNYPKRRLQYNIYLGTQKLFFFPIVRGWHVFSVITGLLVPLKARSEEPKYDLLTRVRSIFLFFLTIYVSAFFWQIVGLSASLGQLWPKVNQIDMIFSSNAFKCYLFSWNSRHIPPVGDSFQSLRKKTCEVGNSTIKHVTTSKTAYDRKNIDVWVPR